MAFVWPSLIVWLVAIDVVGYVGSAGGGGGAVGAEDPSLGATGANVAPFNDVVPCN